jgi:glycogen(starch) synthase
VAILHDPPAVDALVVTSLYPPHSYGGYEASCRDVVERWRRRGHRVTVLTSDTRVAGVDADDDGGVRRELAFYWVDHALPARSWRERLAVERHNRDALARALSEVRPQVVSFWSMGALSLGLLNQVADAGLPLVLVICDDWLVYGERADLWRRPFAGSALRAALARRVTGLATRWPSRHADVRVVWVSAAVRDTARRDAAWFPGDGVVIGSGIDRTDFPAPSRPVDRPWSWRLLQAGRLDPRKGVEVGIRALAHLPAPAVLDVVGRGDDAFRRHLDRVVDDLGITGRVRFSAVPRSELAQVYADADVVLFPPVWQEPFGLVPLEAMACGTPVVATGTGGSAEFLEDGDNCLLVRPGDTAALADAVRRLADDPALRRRLVERGLATAAAHDVDRYADRLEAEHLAAVR